MLRREVKAIVDDVTKERKAKLRSPQKTLQTGSADSLISAFVTNRHCILLQGCKGNDSELIMNRLKELSTRHESFPIHKSLSV